MKHFVMFFLIFTVPLGAFADDTFSSMIHSIDYGKANEPHLIRFENSRVAFIDPADAEMMRAMVESEQRNEKVEVTVDAEYTVTAAQSVVPSEFDQDLDDPSAWSRKEFEPTMVSSYNGLLSIFNKMRRDYNTTGECYNRAHVWAYEEYKRAGTNTMKIFMFFTERYIRNYRFKWWFHVTPMAYWSNMSRPRTLDRRYSGGPRQTKIWSDTFIKSKRRCKIVDTFDEYFENQQSEDCYHIYTSMYFVIPRDIEKRDLTGEEKTEFIDREVRKAYRNAFKNQN